MHTSDVLYLYLIILILSSLSLSPPKKVSYKSFTLGIVNDGIVMPERFKKFTRLTKLIFNPYTNYYRSDFDHVRILNAVQSNIN